MSTRDISDEEKERRDRHIRGGRAEPPGSRPSTKIEQGLPAAVGVEAEAEALPVRNYYEGYGG